MTMDLASLPAAPPRPAVKSKQAELLKHITSLHTQEELLLHVDRHHQQLDTINLVTVLYRLARLYSNTQLPDQRTAAKTQLQESASFKLLLSAIHKHLLEARALTKLCRNGLQSETAPLESVTSSDSNPSETARPVSGSIPNAQCISNLMWSLDVLEIMETAVTEGETAPETSSAMPDTASAMAWQVAMAAAPLVTHALPEFTSQGLGNLLWNFAKMPSPPASVLLAILLRTVQLLEALTPTDVPDIQALSHSLRSIAHLRTHPTEIDSQPAWQEAVTNFLLQAAHQCIRALAGETRGKEKHAPTGKTLASIAWSFSGVLGSACGTQAPVSTLFLLIRQHVLARLQADLSNGSHQASFNEQALSRVVQAFGETDLLSTPLLQAVLDAAGLKLRSATTDTQSTLGYQPEELCVLLRSCHTPGVQPWFFLHSLSKRLSEHHDATASWTPANLLDLQRALQLQLNHMAHGSQQRPVPHAYYAAAAELLGRTSRGVTARAGPLASQAAALGSFLSVPTTGSVPHTATAPRTSAPTSAPIAHLISAVPRASRTSAPTSGSLQHGAVQHAAVQHAAVPQHAALQLAAVQQHVSMRPGPLDLVQHAPRTSAPITHSLMQLNQQPWQPAGRPLNPQSSTYMHAWAQGTLPNQYSQPNHGIPNHGISNHFNIPAHIAEHAVVNSSGFHPAVGTGYNSDPLPTLPTGAEYHLPTGTEFQLPTGTEYQLPTATEFQPLHGQGHMVNLGLATPGSNAHTLFTTAGQQRHSLSLNSDARFLQQAWVVDDAGMLQPFTFAGAHAERTASALQHLLLGAPHGYNL